MKEPENITWLITCSNSKVRTEIITSITREIPDEQIVDIFREEKYVGGYKLLSRIGLGGATSIASSYEFVELVKVKKGEGRTICVAEIGVAIGASAVEVCKLLSDQDTYYGFDFESKIEDLISDLKKVKEIKCHLIGMGNTNKEYDSYNWPLSNLLLKQIDEGKNGLFDVIYLDGAHSFFHDGLACCMLKELCKPNGFIIFDDMYWNYMESDTSGPEKNPNIRNYYTDEQLKDFQVQRVVNTFMRTDKRYTQFYFSNALSVNRAVFRRID